MREESRRDWEGSGYRWVSAASVESSWDLTKSWVPGDGCTVWLPAPSDLTRKMFDWAAGIDVICPAAEDGGGSACVPGIQNPGAESGMVQGGLQMEHHRNSSLGDSKVGVHRTCLYENNERCDYQTVTN